MPSTSTAHENRPASSSNTIVHTSEIDQFTYMQEMVDNAFRQHAKESPNESTQRFYNLLAEANQPVFEGSDAWRAVHVDEVFTQTYIRKGTGEYVDERSRKTIEDFSARLTEARLEGGSGPDGRVDADEEMIRTQCWVDTIGGKKKGRLYGVGQLASHYSAGRGGIFRHQPSTSTIFDPKIVVSKDAYDSLLARFEKLENLVRTLVPQQGHTTSSSSQQPCPPQQPPSHTTVVQGEDSDDSDDLDDYHRF